jgi:hypothetical protein
MTYRLSLSFFLLLFLTQWLGCATKSDLGTRDAGPPRDGGGMDSARPDAGFDAGFDCGDGTCSEGECGRCPADCPIEVCGSSCGDGICDFPAGECDACLTDCPTCCGDGICRHAECDTCAADCAGRCDDDCAHSPCEIGGPLDSACDPTVDFVCHENSDGSSGFCCREGWNQECRFVYRLYAHRDCAVRCGDGAFDMDLLEDAAACPEDAPVPDDGVCSQLENCVTDPGSCECTPCGDGVCDRPTENCGNCGRDCECIRMPAADAGVADAGAM